MESVKIPDREEILDELDRICQSEDFKRSPRLASFLKYIVMLTLDGREKEIKGYTIGVEVFGKPEDFDPDSDASVRVEAARLRKTIKLYYHGEGADNKVAIRIPKGAYVPHFYYQTKEEATVVNHDTGEAIEGIGPEQVSAIHKGGFYRGIVASTIVVLILLSILGAYYFWKSSEVYPKEILMPVVAIMPFESRGGSNYDDEAGMLSYEILNGLSRFAFFKIFDVRSLPDHEQWAGKSSDLGEDVGADYVLEGFIEEEQDGVEVNVRLLAVRQSIYVWTFRKKLSGDEINRQGEIEEIAGLVAGQLASPYGTITGLLKEEVYSMEQTHVWPYTCIMDYYAYSNNKSRAGHAHVTNCMEKSVKKMPDFSELWAFLSWMYGDRVRYGFNLDVSREKAIEQSVQAALKGVQIGPGNSRNHQYMANAYKLAGNMDLALEHMEKALSINPYDSEILSDAAWLYGVTSQWELSREYAERAILYNPGHPRWYYGILFVYHYKHGDKQKALSYAMDYYQSEGLLSNLALCAAHVDIGDMNEARSIVRSIQRKFPEFIENPETFTAKWAFEPVLLEKFKADLRKAGIDFPVITR